MLNSTPRNSRGHESKLCSGRVFVLALCAIFIAGILWLAVGAGNKKDYVLYMSIINESVAV